MHHDLVFSTYIVTNHRMGTLYTGHTDSLARRMGEHEDGSLGAFSRKHGLTHLVWFEDFASRDEAFTRERRIKRWKRAWKVRLIEATNPHWLSIANCPMWPPPDAESYPEVHARCMATALPRIVRGAY